MLFLCKNGRGIEWRGQIEPKRTFVKINLKLVNDAKCTISKGKICLNALFPKLCQNVVFPVLNRLGYKNV